MRNLIALAGVAVAMAGLAGSANAYIVSPPSMAPGHMSSSVHGTLQTSASRSRTFSPDGQTFNPDGGQTPVTKVLKRTKRR